MKNSVKDRSNAQTSCAANFISENLHEEYTGGWLHVDMAGPAFIEDRATGQELMLITVHLRRGNGDARRGEARALRALVEELDYDTLLVGDFNMDCDADVPRTQGCNDAFDALMGGDEIAWRPHRSREATHCSRSRYNSILDYVFAAGGATRWSIDVEALDREVYCSRDVGNGAHVPLAATVSPARR